MFTHSFIHSTGIILGIGLIDREAAEEISLIPLLTESVVVSAVTDITNEHKDASHPNLEAKSGKTK